MPARDQFPTGLAGIQIPSGKKHRLPLDKPIVAYTINGEET
jgi:hypothetical protein